MSKYSSIQNFFITNMAALYPLKNKIPNAYSLEDNNIRLLEDSYGYKLNGSSANAISAGFASKTYDIAIVLTKEINRLEADAEAIDNATRLLEEDVFQVQEYFQNIYLSRSDSNCINWPEELLLLEQSGTTGLEFFNVDKANFITIEVTFSCTTTIDFYTP